ncbi:MAG: hypothetical protein JKY19_00195 [Alcanivoracaceae bacterium]|nr:hypothetical protein [Alcanivoracaceae bacterium]
MVLLSSPIDAYANGNNEWALSITPYFWVTGQNGEVATLPPSEPADLDVSFSDVIDNLDMALMGYAEARKGRLGIFAEVFYIGITVDVDTPGPFFSGADYEQDLWALSLGGSYRLTQNNQYQVDALVGLRHWHLENTFDLEPSLLPAQEVSYQESWTDLFAGLKGQAKINEQWYLTGWVASAVAGDSTSHWDIFGAIVYEYSNAMSFIAGYRHQEVNYNNGDFLYDIEMSGPALGLTFKFL